MNRNHKHHHIDALDGVRGLAVLMVLCYHAGGGAQSTNPILHLIGIVNKLGWTGVTLFFVLSGFLITGILWDTREDPRHLRNFYARRSLRIFPLYYAALLLTLLGALQLHVFLAWARDLWVYLLYMQNIPPFDLHPAPLPSMLQVGHFWSLAVEEQFYLLWPFLLLRMKSLRTAEYLCLGVFIASTLCKIPYGLLSTYPTPASDALWANAGSLAIGGYLAISYRREGWARIQTVAPYILLISFCAYFMERFSSASNRVHTITDLPILSVFWASLIVIALRPGIVQRAFQIKALRWTGKISYGIYVYHVLLQVYFEQFTVWLHPGWGYQAHHGVRFVVTVVFTFAISWLSFRYFESPISQLKRRFRSGSADISSNHDPTEVLPAESILPA